MPGLGIEIKIEVIKNHTKYCIGLPAGWIIKASFACHLELFIALSIKNGAVGRISALGSI